VNECPFESVGALLIATEKARDRGTYSGTRDLRQYLYKTLAIDKLIGNNGYNFVTIWKHKFGKNKAIRNMKWYEYDLIEPPKIRDDDFHGGRCKPVKLICDFKSKGVCFFALFVLFSLSCCYYLRVYKDEYKRKLHKRCQLISYGNVLRQISDRPPKKNIKVRRVRRELVWLRILKNLTA